MEIVKTFCDRARYAEERANENIREGVEAEIKIRNLNYQITNLEQEKDALEGHKEKSQQIEQLEEQIKDLESTIALLEKAPSDLLEAQLDWNKRQYPNYFAEL